MSRLGIATALSLLLGCHGAAEPAAPALETSVELERIESRFGRTLLAAPRLAIDEGTDDVPPREHWIERAGVRRAAPTPAIGGWLTGSGAVFVTADAQLIDQDGAVLAEGVEPDVNVSPEGDRIAFAAHVETGLTAVYLLEQGGAPELVSGALDDALMPTFLSDGTLLVTGARHGAVLGLFHLDPRAATLVQLTNHGLRWGQTHDARFVPVPLSSSVVRVVPGGVVYFDGEREQAVSLTPPTVVGPNDGTVAP